MKNINYKLIIKRVGAYIIDIMLVTVISSLILLIPGINKEYKQYEQLHNEYQEIFDEYNNIITLLNKSYNDKKIEKEECQELIKVEKYKDIIEDKYQDQTIEEDEYKEIEKNITKKYKTISSEYSYKIEKKGIPNNLIIQSCIIIYFAIIQCLTKGVTLGKKAFNLKTISSNSKKINIFNYILRSLIINNVLINLINVIFLIYTTQNTYFKIVDILNLLISLIEASTIFLILTREDNRGLHDLICNTKVISTKE